MDENMPVYEWEDALNFIAKRCKVKKDDIEIVLELEEEYLHSIGIISDKE